MPRYDLTSVYTFQLERTNFDPLEIFDTPELVAENVTVDYVHNMNLCSIFGVSGKACDSCLFIYMYVYFGLAYRAELLMDLDKK